MSAKYDFYISGLYRFVEQFKIAGCRFPLLNPKLSKLLSSSLPNKPANEIKITI